jgi:hypothetical protein
MALVKWVGTQPRSTSSAHSDVAMVRVLPVRTVVVPQQLVRADADHPVVAVGHVRGKAACRLGDVDRTERPDHAVLILSGHILASDQQQVVLTEELAKLSLLLGSEGTGDVEINHFRAQDLRQRDNLHEGPFHESCA